MHARPEVNACAAEPKLWLHDRRLVHTIRGRRTSLGRFFLLRLFDFAFSCVFVSHSDSLPHPAKVLQALARQAKPPPDFKARNAVLGRGAAYCTPAGHPSERFTTRVIASLRLWQQRPHWTPTQSHRYTVRFTAAILRRCEDLYGDAAFLHCGRVARTSAARLYLRPARFPARGPRIHQL